MLAISGNCYICSLDSAHTSYCYQYSVHDSQKSDFESPKGYFNLPFLLLLSIPCWVSYTQILLHIGRAGFSRLRGAWVNVKALKLTERGQTYTTLSITLNLTLRWELNPASLTHPSLTHTRSPIHFSVTAGLNEACRIRPQNTKLPTLFSALSPPWINGGFVNETIQPLSLPTSSNITDFRRYCHIFSLYTAPL